MTISAKTSPTLRTPMLISLPLSSVNTRIEPDFTTNTPAADSPAPQTVSPNARNRDCAPADRRLISSRVNTENRSTDARKSACEGIFCASMALAGLDDVFLRSGAQPFLAQQPPHLGGGVVV